MSDDPMIWYEMIDGKELKVDVRQIEDRPICPASDRCCVCDWMARQGPQPKNGGLVGPNHGKSN